MLTGIDSLREQFETKLNPEEETKFQEWKKKYAPKDSGQDYDLRGAFKEGITPDEKTKHFPDTYKKPNHPTFSNESKYATGEYAKYAGKWDGDKYIPSSERYQDPIDKAGTDLIDLNTQGKLSLNDMRTLYTLHLIPSKGDTFEALSQTQQGGKDLSYLDKAQKQAQDKAKERKELASGWNLIKSWGKNKPMSKQETAQAAQEFFSEMEKQGAKPEEAHSVAQGIINKKNIQANPKLFSGLPEGGGWIMDGKGNKRWARPDGSIEEK
jgi:hypothetical protein